MKKKKSSYYAYCAVVHFKLSHAKRVTVVAKVIFKHCVDFLVCFVVDVIVATSMCFVDLTVRKESE
jgi:hypothetical protein